MAVDLALVTHPHALIPTCCSIAVNGSFLCEVLYFLQLMLMRKRSFPCALHLTSSEAVAGWLSCTQNYSRMKHSCNLFVFYCTYKQFLFSSFVSSIIYGSILSRYSLLSLHTVVWGCMGVLSLLFVCLFVFAFFVRLGLLISQRRKKIGA